ncbi:phosphate/phosphite/phosphonate ABC transporter substrate-binding protein [Marinilactibacillus kalidii]|uniref:phosphate/phosphite/phosphonate ABC transporter substrate-binding protein n=1 Tax=Marinilactibacillus kalidii TaxID=2820274 RepID=UPI001ABDC208|nr:phosphate/phosphite/phosphonate ABC transporter substrate-binding protein [Marinilactibacillus kalidii]
MAFRRFVRAFFGLIVLMILTACGSSDGGDDKLVVQFVPTNNDGTMEAKSEPFAEYLSEKLDREVEVTVATDYSTIVEAMDAGQVDIGIMPPAAYVQARDSGGAEAILTSQLGDYDQETGLPLEGERTNTFKGEILVRSDSDMTELTDLRGKTVVTLSPNSASGYIYPIAELREAGIDTTNDLTMTSVSDIPSELSAVLSEQVDTAFVFEGARNVFASFFTEDDLFEDLKVLYLTEGDIPNDAIAVQPEMDAELKEEIKTIFLNMEEDPAGAEVMAIWGHLGYEEAAESAYDTISTYTDKATE